MRKLVKRIGRRGASARVVEAENHGAAVYLVEYRTDGRRRRAVYPKTRAGKLEALAFAQGVTEGRTPDSPRLTLEQLYRAFAAEEYPAIRPNTQRLYRENWGQFQAIAGPHTIAEDVGMETCRAVKQELEARQLAVNTIAKVFHTVRRVYRWAEEHELVERARPLRYRYKVAKERRPTRPPEYRQDEFEALLKALPLDKATTWRPHVALTLCGYQGARQWAVLHLKWEDVDFTKGLLWWRAEWDKVGKEWSQPLRAPVRSVLEFARERWGKGSDWVLPRGSTKGTSEVYTIQSLWVALRRAEVKAKVERLPGRAGHGLRRMVVGNVTQATGNPVLGLHAVGDTDLKQAAAYVKQRDDEIERAFTQMDEGGK